MMRFLDSCVWITTSLGLALLVVGLMLVPEDGVFAEEGVGGPDYSTIVLAPCAGPVCDSGCNGCPVREGQSMGTPCIGVGCSCNATPPPGNDCSGCYCVLGPSGRCFCRP